MVDLSGRVGRSAGDRFRDRRLSRVSRVKGVPYVRELTSERSEQSAKKSYAQRHIRG
jgi:hypothetical protein